MKGNTLREIDELTCVVGVPMKVNYNNKGIELGERSGALAASTSYEAGRVRAAEELNRLGWCPTSAGGLVRCCITGGAVKYEKVGQQLQHNPQADGSAL